MTRKSIYLPGPGTSDSAQPHLVPDAAVRGRMLFTCGVAGFNVEGKLPDSNEAQAELIFERIDSILQAADFSREEIGHWFNWAPDRLVGLSKPGSKIGPINPPWERMFPDIRSRPARHALARALDPGMHYRVEIIGVKNAPRKSYEISEQVFHTGGTEIPGFMPFGTTMGDILFTGPTFGMDSANGFLGDDPYLQAKMCDDRNHDLYRLTGHTLDHVAQMFVWYHDAKSREAAMKYTEVMFPNPSDRPAIHYVYSQLPYLIPLKIYNEKEGQFLIQYDMILVSGQKRKVINLPNTKPMDGVAGSVPSGVAMGDLCFTSVCLGQDPRTGELKGSIQDQTRQALRNAQAVVEAAGFDARDIGHVYVWYRSHDLRGDVDKVWAEIYPDPDQRPTRHCVVGDLPADALVGAEITAAR